MTYPLALYREGGQFPWDGRPTDMRVAVTEDDHVAALDDGWMEAADYLRGDTAGDVASEPKRETLRPKKDQLSGDA